jgi:hypothetical protein
VSHPVSVMGDSYIVSKVGTQLALALS